MRTTQTLPCPEHGHPGDLLPESRVIVEIYRRLPDESYVGADKKPHSYKRIDIPTVKILADAHEADVLAVLDGIDILHGELTKDLT